MRGEKAFAVGVLTGVGVACILFGLSGCGKGLDVNHKASGKVVHEVVLNVDHLKAYFAFECEDKLPGDKCYYDPLTEKDKCVDCLVGDFQNKVKL